jgi:CHAD domain-containing protein
MTSRPDEQSLRYDVDDSFALSAIPELTAAADAQSLTEIAAPERLSVTATYFDTEDDRLLDAGIEVRRETGSDTPGWHLRVGLGGPVHELRAGLGRSEGTVPIQFRRLTWIHTRGSGLQPIATVTTDREVRRFGVDGQVLAEVTLDRLVLNRLVAVQESSDEKPIDEVSWQQLGVRFDGTDEVLRKRVDRQLRRLGAKRSAGGSTLEQGRGAGSPSRSHQEGGAKGDQAAAPTGKVAKKRLSPLSPSGDVVVRYLAEEVGSLRDQDIPVRLDRPDSIHQMRVATRRLRSALRTFRVLFAAEAIEPLEAELAWLAAVLGEARDAEVLRERLLAGVTFEQAHHLSTGAVTRAIDRETRQSQRTAFAAVLAALGSERYQLLVAGLEQLVREPPLTDRAGRPARKQLRRLVAATYANVRRSLTDADGLPPGPDRDRHLHAARKAAKRARYAAEAVTPAFGKEAKAFGAAMEHLQDVLGDHHDSVVLQARLHELALAGPPAAAFALGRLHAHEAARQEVIDAAIGRAGAAAEKKSLRGWLT